MKVHTEIVTKEKVVTQTVEEVVGLTLTKREALILAIIGLYPGSVSNLIREKPCWESTDYADLMDEVRDFLQNLPYPNQIEQINVVGKVNETLPTEPPKIKVGDLVKVVKVAEFHPESWWGWAPEMGRFVNDGNFYRVERVEDYHVELANLEWYFPQESLEIVKVG